jgi:hypothetical protein
MDESLGLKDIAVKRLGDDVLISGYPDYRAGVGEPQA